MSAERLIANNPRPLVVDSVERIVSAAHAGDRAALRDVGVEDAEPDLAGTAGAR
jgi:alcohol dehydrogenase